MINFKRGQVFRILKLIIIILLIFDIYKEGHSIKELLDFQSDSSYKPAIESQIIYKIQIKASNVQVNTDEIKSQFKINEEINEVFHNAWYKYSVGSFGNYKQAKDFRENIIKTPGLEGSFIVCFKGNERLDKLVLTNETNAPAFKPKETPQKDIYEYKIQICASNNKKLNIDSISKNLRISEPIREDFHNGWYKYSVGSFSTFKAANEYRMNLIKSEQLKGSFVIALKNNTRLNEVPKATNQNINKPAPQNNKPSPQENQPAPVVKREKPKTVKKETPATPPPPKKTVKLTKKQQAYEAKIKDSLYNDSLYQNSLAKVSREKDSLTEDSIRKHELARTKADSISMAYAEQNKHKANRVEKFLLFVANKYYPKGIENLVQIAVERRNYDDIFLLILFFLINAFILNFIFITIASILILSSKLVRENKIKLLTEQYQDILAEYIFIEDNNPPIPDEYQKIGNDKFKREVLISVILDFNKNLYGETKGRLRELYIKMKLNIDSAENIKNNNWNVKARGFRQLAQMNVTDAYPIVEKYINHPNEILSAEAQLALVQLNEESPFSFLDKLKKFFPLWNQINILSLITANNIKIPEFSRWLTSNNDYVKIFALRVIALYQQQKAFSDIMTLLKSPNIKVRKATIITLSKLGLNDALTPLKQMYDKEDINIKLLILKSLQRLPDEANMKFLGDAINESNYEIRLEAIRALIAVGETGRGKINMLKMTTDIENIELISIINHALDSRIN